MARMKNSGGDVSPGNFEENNAGNYVERAISFGKRKGYAKDGWPVIRSGDDEWAQWMSYFYRIGHAFAKPGSFASRHGVMTVPSKSPDEFEPGWRSREQAEFESSKANNRPLRELDAMSDAERAASRERVGKLISSVKRSIAMSGLNEKRRNDRSDPEAAG